MPSMTEFALPPPAPASVAIEATAHRFPVRRIYCIGRNYVDHAKEMGFEPDLQALFYFMKPADALVPGQAEVAYPPGTQNLHHEVELVVALGRSGRDISESQALDHVFGYAVGNDLTRRDLQLRSREQGRPWEAGKAFDACAVVGDIVPVERWGHPGEAGIWLDVNGQPRQRARLSELIFAVPRLIAHLSSLQALMAGDLIFTGTPAGVGPLRRGDIAAGGIDGLPGIQTRIV